MSGYTININGECVGTLYDDGDIYSGGKCVGHLYEDGDIYSGGSKVASMGSDGTIWNAEGSSGYRVYDDGDIYYYGRCVGSIWNYDRFLEQRNPEVKQSKPDEHDRSGGGFAKKAAGAAETAAGVAGAAGAAGSGCEGLLVGFVIVGLIVAAVVNWAAQYVEAIVLILSVAIGVYIAYRFIGKKGGAEGASDTGQSGIGAKWNATKAERAAQKEQRAAQKAQAKAAQEAAQQQTAHAKAQQAAYQQPVQNQSYAQSPYAQGQQPAQSPYVQNQPYGQPNAWSNNQYDSTNGKTKIKHLWAAILGGVMVLAGIMLLATGEESNVANSIVEFVFAIPLIWWFCFTNGFFGGKSK